MKRFFPIYLIVIAAVAIVGILYVQFNLGKNIFSTIPVQTSKEIIFPKGGETLTSGKIYTLKWTGAPGDVTQIFLKGSSLEAQGESVSLIDRVYDVPNTGSYDYKIPATANGKYIFEIGPLVSKSFAISANPVTYCNPNNLTATITTEGAAGSVYGTFKITNTSSLACQILGKNYIQVEYDKTKTANLSIAYLGHTQSENFVLQPNQTIYSQFRSPNGPQCTQVTGTGVSFTYKISAKEIATFMNQGLDSLTINTCVSPQENTEIQIWNMSKTPITPQ